MGIKGLTKLLGDNAPGCMKEHELKTYFGRKVAIDASMCIYQFLVAVRQGADNLTNDDGVITSHLSGIFYRTIRLMEMGIKPCYVFDGKPPELKKGELAKRAEAKREAMENAQQAAKEGDQENLEKFSRRINKVTPEVIEQCKTLLKLMGVPVIQAPGEAEAQCAQLCKQELVYATVSEDMDSLTFATPRLIRHMWVGASPTAEKKGTKPLEIIHANALAGLAMTQDEFIDLGILCGCDYVQPIRGIGPTTALKLIKKHGDIKNVISALKAEGKHQIPDDLIEHVDEIRELFKKPDVDIINGPLKWTEPDKEGLIKFLVQENQFNQQNIENGIKRLQNSKGKSSQCRLDTFFKKIPQDPTKQKALPPTKGTAIPVDAKRKASVTSNGKTAAKKVKK